MREWVKEEHMHYVERQVDGRNIYFVGEEHCSRAPIIQTHETVVPRIDNNPSSWLVLSEDGNRPVKNVALEPGKFYFQKLARIYGLPYDDALTDIYSADTRRHIKQASIVNQLNKQDIISWFTIC